jgi:hypothetical protein
MCAADFSVVRYLFRLLCSRDSSIGIATGYGTDGRGSIPGREKISLFYTVFRPPLGPTPNQWVQGALISGLKRQGRETYHSPPSSVEGKIGGVMSQFLHTSSWRGAYLIKRRDTSTLSVIISGQDILPIHGLIRAKSNFISED